jgi:hypothetical protein
MDVKDEKALLEVINKLLTFTGELAVTLMALQAYAAEQPTFDAAQYQRLYDRYRTALKNRLPVVGSSPEALLAFLKEFQGPTQ